MAVDEKDQTDEEQPGHDESVEEPSLPVRAEGEPEGEPAAGAATKLGSTRYVLAGFLLAAIAIAYVFSQAFAAGWAHIAEAQWAVDKAAWLTRLSEDERHTWATVGGGVIGLLSLLYVYRRPDIRLWVNEAAVELSKVTWPTKKEVTRNTAVVVVASLIATFYLALLDRFWGFVTNLVYGI